MFLGTIEAEVRSIVLEQSKAWGDGDIWIGCSGNLTLERVLDGRGRPLHGNDVSIYTCALGWWASGQPVPHTLKAESQTALDWLSPYLDGGVGTVATLMLGTRFLGSVGRANAYHERNVDAYRRQFAGMHDATVKKLNKVTLRLASFAAMDVREYLRDVVPADAAVAAFPPYDCIAPEHRVLTDDLQWIPAGDVVAGQRLLAFDEHPQDGSRMHRWRFATVTHSSPKIKKCVRVWLENGDVIECSAEHPWLTTTGWVRADQLCRPSRVPNRNDDDIRATVLRPLRTWAPERTYAAGWLSGMFDGEGCLKVAQAGGHGSTSVNVAQVRGRVADHVVEVLRHVGFDVRTQDRTPYGRPHHKPVVSIEVAGGFAETVRALGVLRPIRLLDNFRDAAIHRQTIRARRGEGTHVRVAAVEPIGEREVQAFGTTTGTFVAEGYLMHNTAGYENMWKPLEAHFDWPAPSYEVLDEDGIRDTLDLITRREHWFFGSNHRWPEWESNLRGLVQAGMRRRPMFVYGSDAGTRVVRPRQSIEPVTQRRLGHGDELGDRMVLAPLTAGQFAALRSQYLDPKIAPAMPLFAVAVLVDGAVIGCFGYMASEWRRDQAYLLSDFAVGPTDYPRLSKLVAMAAVSSEAQLLCERALSRRIRSLSTTAFSDRPVSMKYRGVLDCTKRTETPDGEHRYQLQYEGAFGRWTLAEALAEWKRKHGSVQLATAS